MITKANKSFHHLCIHPEVCMWLYRLHWSKCEVILETLLSHGRNICRFASSGVLSAGPSLEKYPLQEIFSSLLLCVHKLWFPHSKGLENPCGMTSDKATIRNQWKKEYWYIKAWNISAFAKNSFSRNNNCLNGCFQGLTFEIFHELTSAFPHVVVICLKIDETSNKQKQTDVTPIYLILLSKGIERPLNCWENFPQILSLKIFVLYT